MGRIAIIMILGITGNPDSLQSIDDGTWDRTGAAFLGLVALCCTMLYHVAPCCTRCSVRCDKTTLRSILAGSRAGAAAHATVGRGQRTRTKQRRHPVQGRRSWDVIRGHETWISTDQSHQRERERVFLSSCVCSTLRPETIRWLNRFLKKLLLPTLSSPLPDD